MSKYTVNDLTAAVGIGTTVAGLASNVINRNQGSDGNKSAQMKGVAAIRQSGVLRTSLFSTMISMPISLKGKPYKTEEVMLYAETVNLPGVNIGTTQNRRYGFGPNQRYANDVSFNDLTISFIGDGNGMILSFFNDWMNSIVRYDGPIVNSKKEGASPSSLTPFFFEYKQNYVAPQFQIVVFNEKRDSVAVYNMEDTFPVSVSDVNMGWGNTDELARFVVTFAYTRWSMYSDFQTLKVSNERNVPQENSIYSMIFKGGSAATTILSLKKPTHVGDVINVVNNAKLIFGG